VTPARGLWALAVFLSAAAGSACGRRPASALPWTPTPAPDLGEVVARVGEVPIFAGDVAAQAARAHRTARAALEELVALHVLAERARSSEPWPPAGPEAAELRKQTMVQRLLEREFEPATRPEDITDPELRVLYDRAKVTFVHPHLVEVVTIEVVTGARATAAGRSEARQSLQAVKALIDKEGARTVDDWKRLAAQWAGKGVKSLHFLQGPDGPRLGKFAATVSSLAPGQETGLIEDEHGLYYVRSVGERAAKNESFEQVRGELRAGYHSRWRQRKFLDFAARAADRHDVSIRSAGSAPAGS
jgi:hypothetical protein